MRFVIACLPLALVAACGGATNTSTNTVSTTPAAPATATAPAAPATPTAPAAGIAPAPAPGDPLRAQAIVECSREVTEELGPERAATFCGCAYDQMLGGADRRQAEGACVAQLGLPPGQ